MLVTNRPRLGDGQRPCEVSKCPPRPARPAVCAPLYRVYGNVTSASGSCLPRARWRVSFFTQTACVPVQAMALHRLVFALFVCATCVTICAGSPTSTTAAFRPVRQNSKTVREIFIPQSQTAGRKLGDAPAMAQDYEAEPPLPASVDQPAPPYPPYPTYPPHPPRPPPPPHPPHPPKPPRPSPPPPPSPSPPPPPNPSPPPPPNPSPPPPPNPSPPPPPNPSPPPPCPLPLCFMCSI